MQNFVHSQIRGHQNGLQPADFKLQTKRLDPRAIPTVNVQFTAPPNDIQPAPEVAEILIDEGDEYPADESAFSTQPPHNAKPASTASSYPPSHDGDPDEPLQLNGPPDKTVRLERVGPSNISVTVEPPTPGVIEPPATPARGRCRARHDADADRTPKLVKVQGPMTRTSDGPEAAHGPIATDAKTDSPMRGLHHARPQSQARRDDQAMLYLDRSPDDLENMDLQTLQSEPFDDRPRSGQKRPLHSRRRRRRDHDTLVEDLEAAFRSDTMDETSQIQLLLDDLTKDEWESAGDWFLARFGALLKIMTEQRSQKRKLTLQFEAFVAARDRLVARHVRVTDQALEHMKQNGGSVLPSSARKVARAAIDR